METFKTEYMLIITIQFDNDMIYHNCGDLMSSSPVTGAVWFLCCVDRINYVAEVSVSGNGSGPTCALSRTL